jgi:signal transduction histidine kinase
MTLLASVATGLLCTGFSALVLTELHRYRLSKQTGQELTADLRVADLLARDDLPRLILDRSVTAIQVVDVKGRIVATDEQMAGKPRVADFVPAGEAVPANRVICEAPGFPDSCLVVVAVRFSGRGNEWIVYDTDLVIPWYVSRMLLAELVGASALLIAVSAALTHRTVGRALAPVGAVVRELGTITATDPGRRVPVSAHDDEIRELADAVNQTLDRLEEAVMRQRRFTSDASHDLRSPITAMRLQVEQAQLHPEETDWPKTANALEGSLDRLEAIVTDLLVLARLDSGSGRAKEAVDLCELIGSEFRGRSRTGRVAIGTAVPPEVMVTGDRLQLIRLLTNLVDNAERHATSSVQVAVRRDGDRAVLEVTDDGPGIPPDQWERVFDRFTQLDTVHNRNTGGTGLGLPIARGIAEQHGGTLTIEPSERGARFVLIIPIHDPASTDPA